MTAILTSMTKQHGKMKYGERGGMEVQSVTIGSAMKRRAYKHEDTEVSA